MAMGHPMGIPYFVRNVCGSFSDQFQVSKCVVISQFIFHEPCLIEPFGVCRVKCRIRARP